MLLLDIIRLFLIILSRLCISGLSDSGRSPYVKHAQRQPHGRLGIFLSNRFRENELLERA